MVLLKNDDKVLPIADGKKIAVVGRYANKRNTGDHGSSNVFSPYAITPYEGIKNRFGEENVSVYNGSMMRFVVTFEKSVSQPANV